jgi:adenine-specific DNA-methyltransferase
MKLNPVKPRKALNKAWLKTKPNRSQVETFKLNLYQLIGHISETESEEFHKNLVSHFLKNTYYHDRFFINTKEREDLAIYTGKNADSPVGVIIEAKKPSNKAEMLSPENINTKALHELILYYMRERISGKNLELKYLVATNIYEWFIFDASDFEKWFAKNRSFVNKFADFEEKRLSGTDTNFFYKNIAAPFVESLQEEISFTYFDLHEIEKPLRHQNPANDTKLIPFFKIFSPEHLLKLPFANDSNSLDRGFYNELLHLIGLEETKEGSKKVIGRQVEGKRNSGSLIENAITILNYEDCLSSVKRSDYGNTKEEQLFNVALELSITWINRILFLKLLEGQLVKYHRGDKSYKFLSTERIPDYDALNKLFFQVLAVRETERSEAVKKRFGNIPYLNSSLFEPNNLEHKTIRISNLEDEYTLPVLPATVLTDRTGKKVKGRKNPLQYLFEFLDAYDFASEGSEEIQEENKTLINASVLGLIFEKINGYKDGSFFTPGFITMYMARETVRRAVVEKFNECLNRDSNDLRITRIKKKKEIRKYKSIDDVYNAIGPDFTKDEANEMINSLKVCDPAVGSGHFLVSVLNEIIALKSDLKILTDRNGRILRDYHVEVANDELVITDDEGLLFEYHPGNPEKQRVQEALFHEKQTIIENCLFGVDINPNSVKICRLRLWIELLKNAYYKKESEFNELEILPNIDINIKCGNSLVSQFPLKDITEVEKRRKQERLPTSRTFKYRQITQKYKELVWMYKTANDRSIRNQAISEIKEIKNKFSQLSKPTDKDYLAIENKQKEMALKQQNIFSSQNHASWQKQIDRMANEIVIMQKQYEEKIKKQYENAFEWRFEFPEVLNDEGDFTGFDIVIGNPPYIRQEEFSALKPVLQNKYETFAGTADLYVYFIELGLTNLKPGGEFTFIVPNKWMRAGYGKQLRRFLKKLKINAILDFGDLPVFDEATTYPCILSVTKTQPAGIFEAAAIQTLDFPQGLEKYVEENKSVVLTTELQDNGWTLSDANVQRLLAKLRKTGTPLGEYVNGKIYRGVLTGLNEAFVIDEATKNRLISEDPGSAEIIKPFLAGRDIKRYRQPKSDKYLIFTRRGIDIEKYPAILNYLLQFKERLEPKPKNFTGRKWKGRKTGSYKWYEIQDAVDYFKEFEKDKILWPGISQEITSFAFDAENFYGNDNNQMIITSEVFLLAILNSKVSKVFLINNCDFVRGGFARLKIAYIELIPIPQVPHDKKILIKEKITQIFSLKKENPEADTSALEAEIDQMVYELYGLTDEEKALVETGSAA